MSVVLKCPHCHKRWKRGIEKCPACGNPLRAGGRYIYWLDAMDGGGRRHRRDVGSDLNAACALDSKIKISRLERRSYVEETGLRYTLAMLRDDYEQSAAAKANRDYCSRIAFVRRTVADLGDNLLARNLAPANIADYQERRRKAGVSGSAINREITYLGIALEWAKQLGKIADNPIAGAGRLKENAPRSRILTLEEYTRISTEIPIEFQALFRLRYLLPFRGLELLALDIEHVSLEDRGFVRIPQGVSKSSRERFVPLWYPCAKIWLQAAMGEREEGPLFVLNGQRMRYSAVDSMFTRACARAGIVGFQFRDLRHCAITGLRHCGTPLSELARASDQKSLLIQDRYDNPTLDMILGPAVEYYNPKTGIVEPMESGKKSGQEKQRA